MVCSSHQAGEGPHEPVSGLLKLQAQGGVHVAPGATGNCRAPSCNAYQRYTKSLQLLQCSTLVSECELPVVAALGAPACFGLGSAHSPHKQGYMCPAAAERLQALRLFTAVAGSRLCSGFTSLTAGTGHGRNHLCTLSRHLYDSSWHEQHHPGDIISCTVQAASPYR